MPQVTIVPSPSAGGGLSPIVLEQPTPGQVSDIVRTLRTNGIPYSINYDHQNRSSFRYSLAPAYTSR